MYRVSEYKNSEYRHREDVMHTIKPGKLSQTNAGSDEAPNVMLQARTWHQPILSPR